MLLLIAGTALVVVGVAIARTFAEAHWDDRCVINTLRRIDAPMNYISCPDRPESTRQ